MMVMVMAHSDLITSIAAAHVRDAVIADLAFDGEIAVIADGIECGELLAERYLSFAHRHFVARAVRISHTVFDVRVHDQVIADQDSLDRVDAVHHEVGGVIVQLDAPCSAALR